MSYLITQTFVLLLVASALGLVLGWYLTRISHANARDALEVRLANAETDARELRAERDAAVNVRDVCETERRMLTDELSALQARQTAADAGVAALEAELAECRSALEATTAPAAAGDREVDSAAIASAALAAAAGAQGLIAEPAAAESQGMVAEPAAAESQGMVAEPAAAESQGTVAELAALAADVDASDDLQQIKGIGPKIADTLRDLGVSRFDQIAAWTPEAVEKVNARLKFRGRVEREQWIPQARALMAARERSD